LGYFDVNTIDKEYILGGTGYLQNPNEIDLVIKIKEWLLYQKKTPT
jgi:hypothetical protein